MTFEEWWHEWGVEMAHIPEKSAARTAWNSAVAAEREACAKVCEEYAKNSSNPMNFAENCAEAIRARSNAEIEGGT